MKSYTVTHMGTKPIVPLIFSLSAPVMLSLAVQALYNIIDSIYISHYSASGLAALSLAFPVQTLITAVASGTGVGTNILIAKALGASEEEKASSFVLHGFLLSLLNWAVFVIIGMLLLQPYFSIFSASSEVASMGMVYLKIVLIGSIAPFVENVAVKILQAAGNTISPMIFQSFAAIVNLVLDPLFIWGFGIIPQMGISGAAIATVFAQFISAALSVFTVFFRQNTLRISIVKFHISITFLREIFITGLPSVLGMALVSVYISGLNAILSSFSEEAVSSLGVYYKLQTFLLIPTYGLNQGITPVLSYNFGAIQYKRMWTTLWYSLIISTITLVAGSLIFLLFTQQIFMLFSASEGLLLTGIPALRIISTSFPFFSLTIFMPTLFQSTGYLRYNIMITILREVILLVPLAWLLSKFGLIYTWLTFPLSEIIAALLSCYYTYILYKGPLSIQQKGPKL